MPPFLFIIEEAGSFSKSSLHGQSFFKPRELMTRARKERTETNLCNINEFTVGSIISFKDTISACTSSFRRSLSHSNSTRFKKDHPFR